MTARGTMPSLRLKITGLGLTFPDAEMVYFLIGPDFEQSQIMSSAGTPGGEMPWDEVLLDEALLGPLTVDS